MPKWFTSASQPIINSSLSIQPALSLGHHFFIEKKIVIIVTNRKILVSHPKLQRCPQFDHVVSCGWWRGDGGSMWGHPSTNHNSSHGWVVDKVMVLGMAPKLLLRIKMTGMLNAKTNASWCCTKSFSIYTTVSFFLKNILSSSRVCVLKVLSIQKKKKKSFGIENFALLKRGFATC